MSSVKKLKLNEKDEPINLDDYSLLPMTSHGIHMTSRRKQLVNMVIVPPASDDMVVQVSECNHWLLFKFAWPSIVSDPNKLMQLEEAMSKQPGVTPYVFSQAATAHLMSLREKRSNTDESLVSLYKVPTLRRTCPGGLFDMLTYIAEI